MDKPCFEIKAKKIKNLVDTSYTPIYNNEAVAEKHSGTLKTS